MKQRFTILTMVLLVLFCLSLFGAENYLYPVKTSKVKQVPDYTKTTPAAYLDWTMDASHYYLSSGAAADTFAVYMAPAGTGVTLNTIESSWFDGTGGNNVLFYAWEVGPDCPPSGLSNDTDGTNAHVIGNVLAGPIPFAPAAGYDWQSIELSVFSGDVVIGSEDNPVPFFIGYVKLGEAPYPLAADATLTIGQEINHTFIKGPNFSTANEYWSYYNTYIELCMRAGVTYIGNAGANIEAMNQLPNTYDGTQDFMVNSIITDNEAIPAGNVFLKYTVNGGVADSVEMTADADDAFYATLSGLGLVVGDSLSYWISVTDAGDKVTANFPQNFKVIEAMNADANILLVDDGMAIAAAAPIKAWLETLGQQVEHYVVADNNGWDASITTYTGNSETIYDAMIIMGFGTTTIPTRAYEADHPVASYLAAGGNLLYADQDYFFTNGEVAAPEFAQDDFAYDFFSINEGNNDPAENAIVAGYGVDILEYITEASFDYSVFESTNWPDFVTAEDATDIFLAIDPPPGGTYSDLPCGTIYAGDGFNTILFTVPILAMNEGTAEEVVISRDFERLMWYCLNTGFGLELPNSVENDGTNLISKIALSQNYPNPFNPVTNIQYTIPQAMEVEIAIYNSIGQKVRTLVNGNQAADTYTITWDATNDAGNLVSSGIYYYRLKAGDVTKVHKMILLK